MQRYFSNEPPVYSKPKPPQPQSGPTTPAGSRPPQQHDVTPRPPPPISRPPVVQPPPAIPSPLASSSPSRPTPPPKPPASTIPPAIPHPLPPTAHTPHSDHHSPIPTQYHTTVSLDPVPSSVNPFWFLNLIADNSSEATSTAASIFVPFTALAQPRSNSCTQ